MKRLVLLCVFIISSFFAHAQNPFTEYGYIPKIGTLSQGQYNEFFDNDTLVQIGSVLFNTKSKQIVAFVEMDTLYSEATLQPDIVSRWISPDPLADHPTQIGWSPYQYAMNNPILLTDPDGRCPICPWLDAIVDVAFVAYDAGELIYDKVTTCQTSATSWAALGADAASILVPISTGAGLGVRAAAKTGETLMKVEKVESVVVKTEKAIVKEIGPAGDAGGKIMKQLPENMQKNMRTSDNGGTIFKDPKNPGGNNVRVETGKASSPNPAQQNPYVKHVKDGKVVDVNGKPIPGNKPGKTVESHIPKDDFKYKQK